MAVFSEYVGTALGWIIVVAAGGAVYLHYKNDHKRRPIQAKNRRFSSSVESDSHQSRNDKRATIGNKPRSSRINSQADSTPSLAVSSQASQAGQDVQDTEDMSWATELADLRKGSSLTGRMPDRKQTRPETARQIKSKMTVATSGRSSTTGDEHTPNSSSSFSSSLDLLSNENFTPVAGDIRDMLEPTGNSTSVLRLIESENRPQSRTKPGSGPVSQGETKKQRQNRRKAEERKQQNEGLEQVRKRQLESQRRTARETRGEPAKNGLASVIHNAWDSSKNTAEPRSPAVTSLLDTFGSGHVPNGSGKVTINAKNGGWQTDLPNEEEQIRRLLEEDESSWKTVSKKPRTKYKNTTEADDGAVKHVDLRPESEIVNRI